MTISGKINNGPVIVIPAYNRPGSLQRLLNSLIRSDFAGFNPLLHISIDGPGDPGVIEVATNLDWPFGEKVIDVQVQHMGLKDHILKCGGLSSRYGSIIMLEDDLIVSPAFYQFGVNALRFYEHDPKVAGISLYSYRVAESCFFPFEPLNDGNAVFFIQFAISWGQVWTSGQWAAFQNWYETGNEQNVRLPEFLDDWPDSSWKKEFIKFLLSKDLYFSVPYVSYTSNFHEKGTSADTPGLFQVPLALTSKANSFVPFDESRSVYNVFFEPTESTIKSSARQFQEYNFDVDLYGTTDLDFLKSEFILTRRKVNKSIKSYSASMNPPIWDIIQDLAGSELFFAERKELLPAKVSPAKYFAKQRGPLQNFLSTNSLTNIPKISIVVLDFGNFSFDRTFQSIQQNVDASVQVIRVRDGHAADKGSRDEVFDIQMTQASYIKMLLEGLSSADGDIVTWMESGQELLPKSLWKISEMFGKLSVVQWVNTIPPSMKSYKIRDLRMSAYLFSSRKPGSVRNIMMPGTVFWRTSLLRDIDNNHDKELVSDLELWSKLFQGAQLYTFDHKTLKDVDPQRYRNIPAGDYKLDRTGPGTITTLIANSFKFFYNKDIPYLRSIYRELYKFPGIIRYQDAKNSYYLSDY